MDLEKTRVAKATAAVRERALSKLGKGEISVAELAKRTGLPWSTIKLALYGEPSQRETALARIEVALAEQQPVRKRTSR